MAGTHGKEKMDEVNEEMLEPSLEERLESLNLQGEEEEDLDFSGEFEELVKDVR